MKKLLTLFALALLLLAGCSKSDPIDIKEELIDFPSPSDKTKKEYGISIDDLEIESQSDGIDTTKVYFNGTIGDRLWIGEFNKETKKQTLEWIGKEQLENKITFYSGYGEYKTFVVNRRKMDNFIRNKETFAFRLSMIGDNDLVNDLYIIKDNNTLLNKFRKPISNILTWHEGFALEIGGRDAMVVSAEGDSLFTFNELHIAYSTRFTLNYEDCIIINTDIERSQLSLEKRNVKDNTIYFKYGQIDLINIPKDSRIDAESFSLMDNILTYSLEYTSFKGERGLFKLELDVNSGEHKII